MQDGEAVNFLRLATALKILLSSSIDEPQLQRAETLLLDYLQGLKELYSEANMKPNHACAPETVGAITSKLNRSGEAHGTVEEAVSGSSVLKEGLCQVRNQHGTVTTVANTKVVSAHARAYFFGRYNSDEIIRVRCALDRETAGGVAIPSEIGQFYNYTLLDGRRLLLHREAYANPLDYP
ncbi:hypothetical protein BD410DRAFT_844068 [Rickenella mellea]|uniref:Uncharacterized protein n=1 Tax=Rickenella mellea TaxID=50990 RepID=A0A4Y7PPV6_9AGAM|nr:hypothetical protein BD410DRAFT_844068 [Rickenella mellea]